eukprot:13981018-Ditylum_brightwellii.AAC.1
MAKNSTLKMAKVGRLKERIKPKSLHNKPTKKDPITEVTNAFKEMNGDFTDIFSGFKKNLTTTQSTIAVKSTKTTSTAGLVSDSGETSDEAKEIMGGTATVSRSATATGFVMSHGSGGGSGARGARGHRGGGSRGGRGTSEGGAPAPGALGGTAPTGLVFALTLLKVNPAVFINYSTTTGIKLFQSGTEALPIIFNANSKQVSLFCKLLQDRAKKLGWDLARGKVVLIPDLNGQNQNLITRYGQLTTD